MGCSESHGIESPKKIEKLQPFEQSPPKIKSKNEEKLHFLIGNIAENEYLFGKVSVTNRAINKLSIPIDFKPYNFSSMLDLENK